MKFILGIGDDLFEAFFADDEPSPSAQKKKPTTAAPEVSVEPAKPAVKKTNKRKTNVKKTTSTKKVTAAPPKPAESVEKDEEKPQFQHTPALLELAQQNADEKVNSAEKTDSNSTESPKV